MGKQGQKPAVLSVESPCAKSVLSSVLIGSVFVLSVPKNWSNKKCLTQLLGAPFVGALFLLTNIRHSASDVMCIKGNPLREQDVPKRTIRLMLGPLANKTAVVRCPGPWYFPRRVTELTKGRWSAFLCDVYAPPPSGETSIGIYMGEKR